MRNLLALMFATAALAAVARVPVVRANLALPKTAKAGSTIAATVTMRIPSGHHAYAPPQVDGGSPVVELCVPKNAKYRILRVGYPQGRPDPNPVNPDVEQRIYEGTVRIPLKITLPSGVKGSYKVTVELFYQICDDKGACYPPKTVTMSATVKAT